MNIRKFNKDDSEYLEQIFKVCFGEEYPFFQIESFYLVVALDDNKIIAGGGISDGELHARVLEIYIAVLPEHSKKGIGFELHKSLLEISINQSFTSKTKIC